MRSLDREILRLLVEQYGHEDVLKAVESAHAKRRQKSTLAKPTAADHEKAAALLRKALAR